MYKIHFRGRKTNSKPLRYIHEKYIHDECFFPVKKKIYKLPKNQLHFFFFFTVILENKISARLSNTKLYQMFQYTNPFLKISKLQ